MNRRTFVSAASALALTRGLRGQCQATPAGPLCTATVDIPNHLSAIHTQDCPEWCWAASISMIFGFYNHEVEQEDIVRQVYGTLQCFPAGTRTIPQALSRAWTDADGQKFRSRVVAAYDPLNGVSAINNAIIVNELQNDRPLLYCNTHHAMVVGGVVFYPTPNPTITTVGVIDPWPSNPRLHNLSQAEMYPIPAGQMTFVATIRVEDV